MEGKERICGSWKASIVGEIEGWEPNQVTRTSDGNQKSSHQWGRTNASSVLNIADERSACFVSDNLLREKISVLRTGNNSLN